MRHRSRQSYALVNMPACNILWWDGSTTPQSAASTITATTSMETMDDDGHGDKIHSTSCVVWKSRVSSTEPRVINKFMSWADDARTKANYTQTLAMMTPGFYGTPGPTVTSTLKQKEAVMDMTKGLLSGEVLTPIFFKELPELKSTYKELTSKKFGVKKFANKFLAYEFGILPFIDDLTKLRDSWSKIRGHVDFVNSHQGAMVPMRKSCGYISGTYTNRKPISAHSYADQKIGWKGKVTAHVRGRFFRQYTTTDQIKASLDYYGGRILNNVWEALPYSFVCDWFFDVGGMISMLHPKFQVPCYTVLDSCTTVKADLIVPTEMWDDKYNSSVHVGDCTVTYFSRGPGVNLTPPDLTGPGLSTMRTALGIALIIQKV